MAGQHDPLEVVQARQLGDGVVVAHVHSVLNGPSDPLAGENAAMATAVLVEGDGGWRITAFHNTLIQA